MWYKISGVKKIEKKKVRKTKQGDQDLSNPTGGAEEEGKRKSGAGGNTMVLGGAKKWG